MDENLKEIIKIREDRMIKAFNQNNMQITFVDNFEQLHNYLKKIILDFLLHSMKSLIILVRIYLGGKL